MCKLRHITQCVWRLKCWTFFCRLTTRISPWGTKPWCALRYSLGWLAMLCPLSSNISTFNDRGLTPLAWWLNASSGACWGTGEAEVRSPTVSSQRPLDQGGLYWASVNALHMSTHARFPHSMTGKTCWAEYPYLYGHTYIYIHTPKKSQPILC